MYTKYIILYGTLFSIMATIFYIGIEKKLNKIIELLKER